MRGLLMATAVFLAGTPAMSSEVFGTWRSAENDEGGYIHVEIGPCQSDAAKVCGKILKAFSKDPDATPPAWLGRNIIEGMVPDGPNTWDDGTIWAPDEDETYSSEMELKSVDRLEVSGCVLGGLVCRGQEWTRVR